MWEFAVSLHFEHMAGAKYIYRELKKRCDENGAVVTSFEENDRVFVVIGCRDYDRARMQFLLSHLICNVICKTFKREFLERNLELPLKEDLNFKAFKNALLNFDKETDAFVVSKFLVFDKCLYLESFYDFKLGVLREKWSELVALANDNKAYLLSNDTFFDLLKFLIENLEMREGEINVVEDGDGYKVLNNMFEEVCEDVYEVEKDENDKLISNLIDLCPSKINLYIGAKSKVCELIDKIFENRVNFCEMLTEKL